jgi:hypothetical protein
MGRRWVFIGWYTTTKGLMAAFCCEIQPGEQVGYPPWRYTAAMTATLLERFPELAVFRKGADSYLDRFPPEARGAAAVAYQDGFEDGVNSERETK